MAEPRCGDRAYMRALREGQYDYHRGYQLYENPYPYGPFGYDPPKSQNKRQGWAEGFCRESNAEFFRLMETKGG